MPAGLALPFRCRARLREMFFFTSQAQSPQFTSDRGQTEADATLLPVLLRYLRAERIGLLLEERGQQAQSLLINQGGGPAPMREGVEQARLAVAVDPAVDCRY